MDDGTSSVPKRGPTKCFCSDFYFIGTKAVTILWLRRTVRVEAARHRGKTVFILDFDLEAAGDASDDLFTKPQIAAVDQIPY